MAVPTYYFLTPFTPANLANLTLWLDADTISGASGSTVTSWSDGSGAGRTFTEDAGNTVHPTFRVNAANGRSAVEFAIGTYGKIGNTSSVVVGSLFVVAKSFEATFTSYRGLFAGNDVGSDVMYFVGNNGTSDWFPTDQPNLTQYVNGSAQSTGLPLTSWTIYTMIDTTPATNASGINLSIDRIYNDRTWYGQIAEVVLYTDAKTATEQLQVQRYLGNKYNITVT